MLVEVLIFPPLISGTVHVEEFKKELKREVQGMTQEVSRLQREKQNMENQIAELFAFHARQKTGPIVSPHSHMGTKFAETYLPREIQLITTLLQTMEARHGILSAHL